MAEKPKVYPEVDELPPHPILEAYRHCQKDDRDLCEQLRVTRLSPEPEPDLDYVVELYGFPPVLKTRDLVAGLKSHFRTDEFRLKWVDDTHALSIFNSSLLAHQACRITFPHFNARMLALGSDQSKAVGRKVAEEMRPLLITGESQPRPKTTAMVARRFVCNALGIRVCVSKEQKEKEEKDLMEAKVAVSRKHRRKEEKEIEEQKEEDEDNEGKDDEEEEGEEGGATEREQKEEIDDHIGQEDIDLQEVAVVSAGEESLVQVFTESRAVSKEVGEHINPLAVKSESKPRPRITAVVAHRLVCSALGVSRDGSKQQRKEGMETMETKGR